MCSSDLRIKSDFQRFDFAAYPGLSFEKPDMETFRNLALAFEALKHGGNMPCILNAANEIAVECFLAGKLEFLNMPELVEKCMAKMSFIENPSLEDFVLTDQEARALALKLVDEF